MTWFQVHGKESPDGATNPNNENREDFFDWWLDRADFYDPDLMPNIRIVESYEELYNDPHPVAEHSWEEWAEIIRGRNARIDNQRKSLIEDFTQLMT